jgi:hypothetical protein
LHRGLQPQPGALCCTALKGGAEFVRERKNIGIYKSNNMIKATKMALLVKKTRRVEFASKKDPKFEMPDNGTIHLSLFNPHF